MTSDPKRPGGASPQTGPEDPWARLERERRAALRGVDPDLEQLGDTARLMHRDPSSAVMVEGPGASNEILQLINESLAAEPERADLWMMRFDVQRTLGLKPEFADALVNAWQNPRLARLLDWAAVRALWDEVAPGEAPPAGVQLPPARAAAPRRVPSVTPAGTPHNRRFADLATRIAGRELGVLTKAYAQLHAKPGFLEDFARKVAPLLRRPTPLQFAEKLTRLGGPAARIFLKREDQRRVAPEDENAAAQAHVAALLGRRTVITGNDVDAHSLALAAAAPRFSLKCIVVVRPGDPLDKPDFIARLRAHGAEIQIAPPDMAGNDPREGALRLWQKAMSYAHLALSLGSGPSPYPAMVNNFQSLLGRETELQYRAVGDVNRSRTMVAAVQSEADSIGFMLPQLGRQDIELMYAEPEPGGTASWQPSARLRAYNGAIREHAWLRATDRIEHVAMSDDQARTAQQQIASTEQISVSLEDARAVALALLMTQRDRQPRDFVVLVA